MPNFDAKSELSIDAPVEEVWKALTTPELIKKYMFGATVVSEWKEGSLIVWKGEWNGKPFEDRGKVLVMNPMHELKYSHISTGSAEDKQQGNLHVVDLRLTPMETGTLISLTQENNSSETEKAHSEKNWNAMLLGLKELLESGLIPESAQEAKPSK